MTELNAALPLTRTERMALKSAGAMGADLRAPVAAALLTGVFLFVALLLPTDDKTGLRYMFSMGFVMSGLSTAFAFERVGFIRLINRLGGAKAIRSLQKAV